MKKDFDEKKNVNKHNDDNYKEREEVTTNNTDNKDCQCENNKKFKENSDQNNKNDKNEKDNFQEIDKNLETKENCYDSFKECNCDEKEKYSEDKKVNNNNKSDEFVFSNETENNNQKSNHENNNLFQQKKLEDIIKELKKNNFELKNNLVEAKKNFINDKLRYSADLDNFKKRIKKEKEKEQKYASLDLIKEILTPFEQLEKVTSIDTDDISLKNFLLGFKIIYQKMKEILEKNGVQEIKALGEKFNPEIHYAVNKISDKNQPNNTNVLVIQKGFFYKDIILKPAMVKVNEWSDKCDEENK